MGVFGKHKKFAENVRIQFSLLKKITIYQVFFLHL